MDRRKKAKLDQTLKEEQVSSAVRALLLLDHSKKAIKQSEILNAIPGPKLPKALQLELWNVLATRLSEMGLSLVGQNKSYFVISEEKDDPFMLRHTSEDEKADRTLLTLILSYIFMKCSAVCEEEILKLLTRLEILSEGTAKHDYFGDVKKKLDLYVEQMYLERSVSQDSGQIEFKWGRRANAELSKHDVLEFVCKVPYNGEHEPRQWLAQWKQANEQQEMNHLGNQSEDDESD